MRATLEIRFLPAQVEKIYIEMGGQPFQPKTVFIDANKLHARAHDRESGKQQEITEETEVLGHRDSSVCRMIERPLSTLRLRPASIRTTLQKSRLLLCFLCSLLLNPWILIITSMDGNAACG